MDEDRSISRRDALRLTALAASAPSALALLVGPARAAQASPTRPRALPHAAQQAGPYLPDAPVPDSWVVRDFPLDQVTLGDGLFASHRDRILNFAGNYPADRMLANFRANAGLDNPRAPSRPAAGRPRPATCAATTPGTSSAPSRWPTRRGSGDAYKDKLDYMVTALGQCQDALAARSASRATIGRVASWAGKFGNAVKLNGAAQYVSLPAGIVSGLTDFTIACWVNPAQITAWSRMFDFGTGTTRNMFLTVSAGERPAVRHHHRRLRRRAADQRHGHAADEPVDPRRGHPLRQHRHALRQRHRGRHQHEHDAHPVEPGHHGQQLDRPLAVRRPVPERRRRRVPDLRPRADRRRRSRR